MSLATKVYATTGRTLLEWEPTAANQQEILDVIIGRSGNLRAPTILANGRYIVGFDEALYEEILL